MPGIDSCLVMFAGVMHENIAKREYQACRRNCTSPGWMKSAVAKLEKELAAKYGESQQRPHSARPEAGFRILAGLRRRPGGSLRNSSARILRAIRRRWTRCSAASNICSNRLSAICTRSAANSASRRISMLGPVQPYDEIFAGYDPSAHLTDDFFNNKLAFVVLLNFPLTTLEERLAEGDKWTRRQWAETRLAEYFSKRIPAEVNLAISKARAEAGQYISEYNIWMHHLIDDQGSRLFPPKMRLLSHWNLRDEIKADYSDAQNGLAKQRMIAKGDGANRHSDNPGVGHQQSAAGLESLTNEVKPAAEKDSDFAPASRDADECAGAQYALPALAGSLSRFEACGSVFAECAHADCATLQ